MIINPYILGGWTTATPLEDTLISPASTLPRMFEYTPDGNVPVGGVSDSASFPISILQRMFEYTPDGNVPVGGVSDSYNQSVSVVMFSYA